MSFKYLLFLFLFSVLIVVAIDLKREYNLKRNTMIYQLCPSGFGQFDGNSILCK